MINQQPRREIEGHRSSRRLERTGFYHITASLAKLTCYPPDQFIFLQSENVDELVPSFAAAFSNVDPHILASADEDGVMRFFDTTKKLSNGFISEFDAHDNAVFDIAWAHSEPWIVTASGDQTAVLWDAPTGKKKAVFKQHTGSLKSVSFGFQSISILATGARDGSILIWDTRCSERSSSHPVPVATIVKAHEDKELSRIKPRWKRGMPKAVVNVNPLQSVTAVLFQSSQMLLSSGTADGIIKMWDVRSLPKKQKKTPDPCHAYHYSGNSQGKHGFSSLSIDSTHSRFYANCTDGTVYAYDCVGLPGNEPAATYTGHANSTFYVKSALSLDDQYLLSGSSDFNAYIWKVNEPASPPVTLNGHSGEVTAVAWSPIDYMKVMTCADDCTMRIWRMKKEGVIEEERPIGEAKWDVGALVSDSSMSKRLPSVAASASGSATASSGQRGDISSPQRNNCSSPKQLTPKRGPFSLKAWATPSPKRTLSAKSTPISKKTALASTDDTNHTEVNMCTKTLSADERKGKEGLNIRRLNHDRDERSLVDEKGEVSREKRERLDDCDGEETSAAIPSQDPGKEKGYKELVSQEDGRTGEDVASGFECGGKEEKTVEDKGRRVEDHSRINCRSINGNEGVEIEIATESKVTAHKDDRCVNCNKHHLRKSPGSSTRRCILGSGRRPDDGLPNVLRTDRENSDQCSNRINADKLDKEDIGISSLKGYRTSPKCSGSPSQGRLASVSSGSSQRSNSKQKKRLNLMDWMRHSSCALQNGKVVRCSSDQAETSPTQEDVVQSTLEGQVATRERVKDKENEQPGEVMERRVPLIDEDATTKKMEITKGVVHRHNEKLQDNQDCTSKRKATKRGRGDQIFDYFQPLKKMRTEAISDRGGS